MYVFEIKESNGDSKYFLSLSRDLETQDHFFHGKVQIVYDLTFKVMELQNPELQNIYS